MIQLFMKVKVARFIHCMKTEVELKQKVQDLVI